MRFFLLALAAVVQINGALAQVNTEKMRIGDEVEGFQTRAAATFTLRTGNTDVLDLGIGGRVDYRDGPFASFLTGLTQFGEADDRVFLNQAFLHLRGTVRLPGEEWIRPEVFLQTERNESTLLTRRYLAGAGLRLALVTDSTVAVFFGTTPMVEYELLDRDRIAVEPETTVARWSNYLVLQVELTDLVTFVNTLYAQPRFDRLGDVRVLDEAGLNVQITEALALRVTMNLRYDSEPPADLAPLDFTLRNGLALAF
jgi:putative salt-induced outer membrane protein YdiY